MNTQNSLHCFIGFLFEKNIEFSVEYYKPYEDEEEKERVYINIPSKGGYICHSFFAEDGRSEYVRFMYGDSECPEALDD